MASLQRRKSSNGKWLYRIQFYDPKGGRQSKALGRISEKYANEIKGHIENLTDSTRHNTPIPPKTISWLENEATENMVSFLAELGYCNHRKRSTLGDFIENYIISREDAAENTIRNYRDTKQKLVDYFQADQMLDHITAGDADDWRQSLVKKGLSESTISKTVKNAKHFFKLAKHKGLVRINPFQHLRAGGEENASRKHYVENSLIDKAIEHAPDIEWKLIIALARYGGLRCPSEIQALKWSDIDWSNGRFKVSSPKTKRQGKPYRTVPLFPELRPLLKDASVHANKGATHVITKHRQKNGNLRTQFVRILKRAGIDPWPRLFQNLRASRETELANVYPMHVVTAWLGNTELVASKHYMQVTPAHFKKAWGAKSGANSPNSVRKSTPQRRAGNDEKSHEDQPPEEDTSEDVGPLGFSKTGQVPPRGVEPLFSG
ncbi:tyrosine-type recombinase/integrase [Bremerella sp. JC770]|uniref:tyrosine-type recombinase/integrase n=1 Tax=Bremerella sp. JC770 TaxID=3232137 RepID=UPI00345740D9